MDLILWRHAEAIDLDLVGDDMLRTLSSKGDKQAARMAAWLDRQLPDGAKVWASPAARTEQTAQALGRKFKTHAALAPLGRVDDLLALVQWPHAKGCVLVVGHQPTLGLAAAYLMTGPRLHGGASDEGLRPWSVKKGGVWWLRHRPREDRGEVVLVAVRTPEQI
jgi:phosphohistidine phosphatase